MARYNFDLKVQTENFEIGIDTAEKYGYFEHNTYGDEYAGGIWFNARKSVEDYDGCGCLPREVVKALRANGYHVSPDCYV